MQRKSVTNRPGPMLQLLAARGIHVLATRELLHDERAGEEFAAPHVRLHVQRLLLLPVPAHTHISHANIDNK